MTNKKKEHQIDTLSPVQCVTAAAQDNSITVRNMRKK
jgi:hypothetical protein